MSDEWSKYPFHLMSVIPHFTGFLSMLGSGWIVAEILCDKKKHKIPYQRIVFALSFFDLLSSFFYFLSKWAQNRAGSFLVLTSDYKPIKGEWQCEMSGFFIYLGSICIPLYNATLSIYYNLTIKHNWRNEKLWHKFEKYAHCIIITIGICFAIAAIPLQLYNNYYFYCFPVAAGYIDGIVYERGAQWSQALYMYTYYAVTILSFIVIVVAMISNYLYVRRITKRQNKYSFRSSVVGQVQAEQHSEKSEERGSLSSRSFLRLGQNNNTRSQTSQRCLHSIKKMAMLYVIPFFLCWVLPVLWYTMTHFLSWTYQVIPTPGPRLTFAVQMYLATALPLQGFFNWFVYMYPRFSKYHSLKQQQTQSTMSSYFNHLLLVLYQVLGYMFLKKCSCCKKNHPVNDDDNDDDHILGSGIVSEMVIFADTEGNIEGEAANDNNMDGKLFISYNESVQADMNMTNDINLDLSLNGGGNHDEDDNTSSNNYNCASAELSSSKNKDGSKGLEQRSNKDSGDIEEP